LENFREMIEFRDRDEAGSMEKKKREGYF